MRDSDSGLNFPAIVTALATAATALLSFLTFRLVIRSELPLVECDDPVWTKEGRVSIRISVQNQSGLRYKIHRCKVVKPRKALIVITDRPDSIAPKPLVLDREIRAAGSASQFRDTTFH